MRSAKRKRKNLGVKINQLNDVTNHFSSIKKNDFTSKEPFSVNSLNASKTQSAYVKAEIGDSQKMVSCTVLIDTGSDYDVVDLRLLNNLRHHNVNSTLLKPKRNSPVAANSERMNQLGDVILNIKLGSSTNCNQKLERKVRFTVLIN